MNKVEDLSKIHSLYEGWDESIILLQDFTLLFAVGKFLQKCVENVIYE